MSQNPIPQLWSHVENNWENPAAHKALLEHCRLPEQLAEVARLYRTARAVPERSVTSDQQLRRIAALAMAQLDVKRESRSKRPPLGKLFIVAFFLLGSVILATLL